MIKKKDRKKGQNKKINANEKKKKQRKKKPNMLIIRDYEEHLLKKQTKNKNKVGI